MQKPAAKNEKKYLLNAKKTEVVPSNKMNCWKSGIVLNNYWLGLVGQRSSAPWHTGIAVLGAKMAQLAP